MITGSVRQSKFLEIVRVQIMDLGNFPLSMVLGAESSNLTTVCSGRPSVIRRDSVAPTGER